MPYGTKRSNSGSISIIFVFIWLFIFAMWITNVVRFAQLDFEEPYKAEIIRGVGVPVFVMGVVIGFMDIGEEEE